ncbi:MAG: LPS export ABC transporter periplasmic protein LptC [Gemmatimonadaceae bacterium]
MRRVLFGPALAVGLVALACKPGTAPQVAGAAAHGDSSDQVMYGIDTYLTDRGLLRAELKADTAYFYDENSRIELRHGLTLTFYGQTGKKTSTLTSSEGTYNTRAAQTEARKHVVVVSEDGKRLTTEQLRYSQTQNLISSDSAFVLTQPERTITGIGFTSDPDLKVVKILKSPGGTAINLAAPSTAAPAPPKP